MCVAEQVWQGGDLGGGSLKLNILYIYKLGASSCCTSVILGHFIMIVVIHNDFPQVYYYNIPTRADIRSSFHTVLLLAGGRVFLSAGSFGTVA
jgi:hypothetical protein